MLPEKEARPPLFQKRMKLSVIIALNRVFFNLQYKNHQKTFYRTSDKSVSFHAFICYDTERGDLLEIHEVWGVSKARLAEYFRSQEDVLPCGDTLFLFGGCTIRLVELPERVAGPLSFPNTRVEFQGPENDTREIYRRFVLQFISAGG